MSIDLRVLSFSIRRTRKLFATLSLFVRLVVVAVAFFLLCSSIFSLILVSRIDLICHFNDASMCSSPLNINTNTWNQSSVPPKKFHYWKIDHILLAREVFLYLFLSLSLSFLSLSHSLIFYHTTFYFYWQFNVLLYAQLWCEYCLHFVCLRASVLMENSNMDK